MSSNVMYDGCGGNLKLSMHDASEGKMVNGKCIKQNMLNLDTTFQTDIVGGRKS
jgi:hypothetical protein